MGIGLSGRRGGGGGGGGETSVTHVTLLIGLLVAMAPAAVGCSCCDE